MSNLIRVYYLDDQLRLNNLGSYPRDTEISELHPTYPELIKKGWLQFVISDDELAIYSKERRQNLGQLLDFMRSRNSSVPAERVFFVYSDDPVEIEPQRGGKRSGMKSKKRRSKKRKYKKRKKRKKHTRRR